MDRVSPCYTNTPFFVKTPPLLPLSAPKHARVGVCSRTTITCRRQSRRKKGPAPVQTRPVVPPPPLVDDPLRHKRDAFTDNVKSVGSRAVIETMKQRRDLLILTEGPVVPGGIHTVLTQRERQEHAVIIASTRNAVLTVAHEARAACSATGTAVIVAAGTQVPGAWQHPAMNANSSKRAVVVIATVRALFHHFLLNGHGRSWFKKVKLLVMLDPGAVLSVGARPQIGKVLRAMTPTQRRKNVVFSSRVEGKAQKDAVFLTERLLRTKRRVIFWDDEATLEGDRHCTQMASGALQHETSVVSFVNHDGIYEVDCELSCEGSRDSENDLACSEHTNTEGDASVTDATQTVGRKRLQETENTSDESGNQSQKTPRFESLDLKRGESGSEKPIRLARELLLIGDWGSLYGVLLAKLTDIANGEVARRVVVIFASGRLAELYATMCRSDGIFLHDVHRRSTAGRRERCFEWFYTEKRAILFASDVITGDVILPKIDVVIMVGVPPQGMGGYERRVRVLGADGEAWVMVGVREACVITEEFAKAGRDVERVECDGGGVWVGKGVDSKAKGRAYLSWISALLTERKRLGWVSKDVVRFANEWATQLFGEIPMVPNSSVKRMPVRHVDGLRISISPPKVKPLTQARNTTRKPKNRFKLKPKDVARLHKIREMEEKLSTNNVA